MKERAYLFSNLAHIIQQAAKAVPDPLISSCVTLRDDRSTFPNTKLLEILLHSSLLHLYSIIFHSIVPIYTSVAGFDIDKEVAMHRE